MIEYSKIEDYKRIGCGCCTGRAVKTRDGYGGYRIAEDKCICPRHETYVDAKKCSHHSDALAANG